MRRVGSERRLTGQSGAGHDLFTINPDGTFQSPLVTGATEDQAPAWSPDGSKVLFTRIKG